MKITQAGLAILLLFLSIQVTAQSGIETYVREGIEFHDTGNYEKAINSYKKALAIDSESALVNYEIALSYFAKGNYDDAIKHSDVVINQNGAHLIEAYMVKGSALDMQGKTKASIKLFEKAIKKSDGHYLLFYNLALNHFKVNDFEKAEKNVIKAIESNPGHSSSHLMLATIHNQKGNVVQTLLSTYYFLFLEPSSQRSIGAYQMLTENFGSNVTKDDSKPNEINIMVSPNDDNQFRNAEMMVSMLEASKSIKENEGKTEDELFVETTESFFKIMGELKKKKNKEIWWTFYTPFFYDLAQSDHLETYCKYITQSSNENSKKWLSQHEEKLIDFDKWLKSN